MTYTALRDKMGRKPIMVVELTLGYCANTYGVAPCTAAVGTTGLVKCYNTFSTCQDTPNFSNVGKTYRFVENLADLPAGCEAFPCLTDISLAPTKIEPNGIGQRASVTVTLRDFPHHDRGIDKYIVDRTYDPIDSGTFFGKLKSRNPYYLNRELVIKVGYIDPDGLDLTFTTDFQVRRYFIESFNGPDANGMVKFVAKDVLKLADNARAKAPMPSDGLLSANMTAVATTLTLTAGWSSSYPTGGGKVRINNEIMSYASRTGDVLSGMVRGLNGTVADTHDAGDSVQLCLTYTSAKPSDILEDLLINYANVDPAFIPSAAWELENDDKLASHNMTVVVPEPTGVRDLITEVLKSTLSYMWWDELDSEIKFKASFPIDRRTNLTALTDEINLIDGSITVVDEEKSRLTEVIVYYNQIDATEEDKKTNFTNVYAQLDADKESVNQYGVKQTLEIPSRWMNASGAAIEVAGRSLNLFKNTPRRIKFKLDAKDSDLLTGDIVNIQSRSMQDVDGTAKSINFLVTKKQETEVGTIYEYEAFEFNLGARVAYIGPNTLNDYDVESEDNKRNYGFIADNDGRMSDGSPAYQIA